MPPNGRGPIRQKANGRRKVQQRVDYPPIGGYRCNGGVKDHQSRQQCGELGKPHPVQDRVGEHEVVRLAMDSWVGCVIPTVRSGPDE